MEATHTPGPWHAHFVSAIAEESDREFYTATGITTNSEVEFARDGARGDLVAWIPHDRSHEANARLIAAAPDLLAALERLLVESMVDEGEQCDMPAAQELARAALAKAR